MPQSFSQILASGSYNGQAVKVTATSSTGTLIHTAVSGETSFDLITLWAQNNDTDGETRTLNVGFGGESLPDTFIILPIPAKVGLVQVCYRLPLRNGLPVRAYADEANDVQIYADIQRVTVT
jgi:hypothetical protein